MPTNAHAWMRLDEATSEKIQVDKQERARIIDECIAFGTIETLGVLAHALNVSAAGGEISTAMLRNYVRDHAR